MSFVVNGDYLKNSVLMANYLQRFAPKDERKDERNCFIFYTLYYSGRRKSYVLFFCTLIRTLSIHSRNNVNQPRAIRVFFFFVVLAISFRRHTLVGRLVSCRPSVWDSNERAATDELRKNFRFRFTRPRAEPGALVISSGVFDALFTASNTNRQAPNCNQSFNENIFCKHAASGARQVSHFRNKAQFLRPVLLPREKIFALCLIRIRHVHLRQHSYFIISFIFSDPTERILPTSTA